MGNNAFHDKKTGIDDPGYRNIVHRSHTTLAMFRAKIALKSAGPFGWVRGTGECARPAGD